jgi:hypothetical protein
MPHHPCITSTERNLNIECGGAAAQAVRSRVDRANLGTPSRRTCARRDSSRFRRPCRSRGAWRGFICSAWLPARRHPRL